MNTRTIKIYSPAARRPLTELQVVGSAFVPNPMSDHLAGIGFNGSENRMN